MLWTFKKVTQMTPKVLKAEFRQFHMGCGKKPEKWKNLPIAGMLASLNNA